MNFWSKKSKGNGKPGFAQQFTLEERVKKRRALEQRYPKDSFSYLVIEGLDSFEQQKNSYILQLFILLSIGVENSMLMTLLLEYLRKSLNLGKTTSLFIEVDGKVKEIGKSVGQLNKESKSEDGFLYIKLKTQNAFGSNF